MSEMEQSQDQTPVQQHVDETQAQAESASEIRSEMGVASESNAFKSKEGKPTEETPTSKNRVADFKAAVKPLVDKAHACYRQATCLAYFELGDTLIKMRDALRSAGASATNSRLAAEVGIKELTSQRVGDYVATAEFYPEGLRDETISFRAYEDARKAAQASIIPPSPETVLQILKSERSGAKARRAIEEMGSLLMVAVAKDPSREYRVGLSSPWRNPASP